MWRQTDNINSLHLFSCPSTLPSNSYKTCVMVSLWWNKASLLFQYILCVCVCVCVVCVCVCVCVCGGGGGGGGGGGVNLWHHTSLSILVMGWWLMIYQAITNVDHQWDFEAFTWWWFHRKCRNIMARSGVAVKKNLHLIWIMGFLSSLFSWSAIGQ